MAAARPCVASAARRLGAYRMVRSSTAYLRPSAASAAGRQAACSGRSANPPHGTRISSVPASSSAAVSLMATSHSQPVSDSSPAARSARPGLSGPGAASGPRCRVRPGADAAGHRACRTGRGTAGHRAPCAAPAEHGRLGRLRQRPPGQRAPGADADGRTTLQPGHQVYAGRGEPGGGRRRPERAAAGSPRSRERGGSAATTASSCWRAASNWRTCRAPEAPARGLIKRLGVLQRRGRSGRRDVRRSSNSPWPRATGPAVAPGPSPAPCSPASSVPPQERRRPPPVAPTPAGEHHGRPGDQAGRPPAAPPSPGTGASSWVSTRRFIAAIRSR